jgi:hexosaminidase
MQLASSAKSLEMMSSGIIPKPASVNQIAGNFILSEKSSIFTDVKNDELNRIGKFLSEKLNPATGYKLPVKSSKDNLAAGDISLTLSSNDEQLGDEGYKLEITNGILYVLANKPAGIFYGVQTIRQLLPASIEEKTLQKGPWEISGVSIRDYPEYSYRGAMLDVARHFFKVNDVKRYIDLMANYKMNVLHLHLTDDQGWRIQIKKWPKLTKVGGSTKVGGGAGGFYTQDQYSDIVEYAAKRYITVIPEVDMPGHTNAALASYPELNCSGKATELYTGTKVGFSTLCTSKDVTYKFLKDVLGEIAALTPGPYLHIGGDESHATKLTDYVPFINRVQDIVASLNKKVIGWDEIALSTLKPNTTVQYWAKADNAKKGVNQGAKVIMSPAAQAYQDMQYNPDTKLGLHWAGYLDVDKAYNWDPATLVPGIGRENILGIEAPLWTETVTNIADIEYMVFPRLPGYAEIGWSAPGSRSWDEYKTRLAQQGERFKALEINFYRSNLVSW